MGIFKKAINKITKNTNKNKNYYDKFLLNSRDRYNPDLQSFIDTAYKNPFVATAFEVLTRAMQNLDWQTAYIGRNETSKQTTNSFVSNTIGRPSMLTNQDEFMTYLMLYYILDGECLIRRVRLSNKFDLILYKKGTYSYEIEDIANTLKLNLTGREVVSEEDLRDFMLFKNTNIYSLIGGAGEGRSTLESLVLLHDFYCLIMTWNNDLLKNDGASPYAVISPDYMQEDSKKELLDKYKKKAKEKGLPLIFEGSDLTIQHLANTTPEDFDYINALDEIRNMIANVLGVPSILLGDRTNQKFSNYKEAKKALYSETILPIAEKIKLSLNEFLCDELEHREEIVYISDRVEVLQEDRNEKIQMLALLSGVLTINELRSEIGYKPYDHEWADKIMGDMMKAPLGEEDDEPITEPVTDEEVISDDSEGETPTGQNDSKTEE